MKDYVFGVSGACDYKRVYDLLPLPDQNQKSFYGKAKVCVLDHGGEVLQSYDTKIMMRVASGEYVWIYPFNATTEFSTTTRKHIKAFSGFKTKDYIKVQNCFQVEQEAS